MQIWTTVKHLFVTDCADKGVKLSLAFFVYSPPLHTQVLKKKQ